MTLDSQPTENNQNLVAAHRIRKYDRRKNNGNVRNFNRDHQRKPHNANGLTRNAAATVLQQSNVKELWAELLRSSDARLRFEVLKYLTDRVAGRPFVAENPDSKQQPTTLIQDNRLQVAIQQLLPTKSLKDKAKGKRKANHLLIEGGSGADVAPELTSSPSPGDSQGHPSSREAGGRS